MKKFFENSREGENVKILESDDVKLSAKYNRGESFNLQSTAIFYLILKKRIAIPIEKSNIMNLELFCDICKLINSNLAKKTNFPEQNDCCYQKNRDESGGDEGMMSTMENNCILWKSKDRRIWFKGERYDFDVFLSLLGYPTQSWNKLSYILCEKTKRIYSDSKKKGKPGAYCLNHSQMNRRIFSDYRYFGSKANKKRMQDNNNRYLTNSQEHCYKKSKNMGVFK